MGKISKTKTKTKTKLNKTTRKRKSAGRAPSNQPPNNIIPPVNGPDSNDMSVTQDNDMVFQIQDPNYKQTFPCLQILKKTKSQ